MSLARRRGTMWSNLPAQAVVERNDGGGGTFPRPQARSDSGAGSDALAIPQTGILPMRMVDGFLSLLPHPTIQQFSLVNEVRYDHTQVAGAKFFIESSPALTVPAQQVWVVTDALFYATAPSTGLASPPRKLLPWDLAGVLRFDLMLGEKSPMQLLSNVFSPYAEPSQTGTMRSGWHFLDTPVGPQRGAIAFALYAQEQASLRTGVTVDVVPRWPLIKVGVHYHGFTIPRSMFDSVWSRLAQQ